ncbi:MAG: dienelactone hydrolase family protein, partial [Bacteroidia bacterium]
MKNNIAAIAAAAMFLFASCSETPAKQDVQKPEPKKIITKEVSYKSADGTICKGFVAYDDSQKTARRTILVVPEWWGCNAYAKKRAAMLAELGYFALAVDMYGEGKQGSNPQEAGALATPFYQNPQLAVERLNAARAELRNYSEADTSDLIAIGYCFGGSMVLNAAALDFNAKAVVSFHVGLGGLAKPKPGNPCRMLICHGEADSFIKPEEIAGFKSGLDSAKVNY